MSTEAIRLSRPLALFMRAHCESRTDPDVKMPQRETREQGVLHLLSIGQESGCARTVCVRCARLLHPVAVRHQAQGVLLRPLRGSAAVGVPLTPHRRAPASGVPRVPCANCARVHMSARPGSPPVGTGIRSVRSHRPAVVISHASPRGVDLVEPRLQSRRILALRLTQKSCPAVVSLYSAASQTRPARDRREGTSKTWFLPCLRVCAMRYRSSTPMSSRMPM
jgi:hypothetical protein